MDVLRAYNKESVTVATTAIGFTASVMNKDGVGRPDEVVFIVETAQIRYWTTGDDPTSSLGLLGEIGDVITISGEANARAFRAIRTGGTSAVIQPQFSQSA